MSRLNFVLFGAAALVATARADEVTCLRDLLPITDKVSFQKDRKGFEKPFVVESKYVIFPEVKNGKLTGFYVYSPRAAKYYDTVQTPMENKSGDRVSVSKLKPGVRYDLTAQPEGLETVTIIYEPKARKTQARMPSSVALGSSIIPVVGALVELQETRKADPVFQKAEEGRGDEKARRLVRLTTLSAKSSAEMMQPLRAELDLRKKWIQRANLDNDSFRDLNRVLQTSCRSL